MPSTGEVVRRSRATASNNAMGTRDRRTVKPSSPPRNHCDDVPNRGTLAKTVSTRWAYSKTRPTIPSSWPSGGSHGGRTVASSSASSPTSPTLGRRRRPSASRRRTPHAKGALLRRATRPLDVQIGRSDAGKRFEARDGTPPDTTAVESLETATTAPISRAALADTNAAMPWSDTDHVADVFALFEEHGVSPGALGVLQDQARRVEDSTADWTPFHRNFPFQGGAAGRRGPGPPTLPRRRPGANGHP
jgi:hypothetical protein